MKVLKRIFKTIFLSSAILFAFVFCYAFLNAKELLNRSEKSPQPVINTSLSQDDAQVRAIDVYLPNLDDAFFINQLSEGKKNLCARIYQGIAAFETEISLPTPISEEELSEIMWLISYDCPELFQISGDYSYYVRENSPETVLSVKPSYVMNADEYETAIKEVNAIFDEWLYQTDNMSDYEKEKLIYTNIIKSCEYQETGPHAGSVYGTLALGRARCEGYAKTLCMALRKAGIQSLILTGEARTSASNEEPRVERHAWNMAKIDGSYCLLDVTWDDAQSDTSPDTCFAYFNLTDEEIARTRSLDEIYNNWEIPACENPNLSFHAMEGNFIGAGKDIYAELSSLLDMEYNKDINYITVKFETQEQLDEFTKNRDKYISKWYVSKNYYSCSYSFIIYSDTRVAFLFNLSYE